MKNIPRLPLHITHLIELLASERASAKEVAALAKQDPSLVVDILKAINSSRYALQTEITDVSYAITYMGFNEVYQIAISRCLMKAIPDSDEFREIYRHSLFLSYIASELCQSYDKKRAPLLSTIGLLHDIGETVLLLLRKQNPKWSLFIEMLDASKLGAMLLKAVEHPETDLPDNRIPGVSGLLSSRRGPIRPENKYRASLYCPRCLRPSEQRASRRLPITPTLTIICACSSLAPAGSNKS